MGRHKSEVWRIIVLPPLFGVQFSSSSSNKTPVLVFHRAEVCRVPFCRHQGERGGGWGPSRPPFPCCCSTKLWFAVHRERHQVPQRAARPSLLRPSRDSPSAAVATTRGRTSQPVNQSVSESVGQSVSGGLATLSLPNKDPQKKKKKSKGEKLSGASVEEERERRSFWILPEPPARPDIPEVDGQS